MKRRIVVAGIGAALLLAGCGEATEGVKGEEARQDGGWTASPRIRVVERQGDGVVVRGEASPGARVVLRGGQDLAFAVGADNAGRFELHVGQLPDAVIMTPEVQIGQFPAFGPERLLLAGEGAPLAALLVEGGASRRLSRGPVLDSVDGDGRGLAASGRATPGGQVRIVVDGGGEVTASADSAGRWVAALPGLSDRSASIVVGGTSFSYPGPGPAEVDTSGRIERSGEGWRVTRSLSGRARQTSWFPDA
ncbi:hypothetical protein [Brevundimonas sp. CEF1]|jgi:hypothetical protein|uniref:hypothetical protein n=1 Tax=Brevundimonas sp. CEF1 TaxID=3442642 RepID=UPI003F516810